MDNTYISTNEFEWSHVEVKVNNEALATLQSVTYRKDIAKEVLYGAGNKGRAIQKGDESCTFSFEILHSELTKLLSKDVLGGYFDISVTYKMDDPKDGTPSKLVSDYLTRCQVTGAEKSFSRTDLNSTHSLEGMCLDITFGK